MYATLKTEDAMILSVLLKELLVFIKNKAV